MNQNEIGTELEERYCESESYLEIFFPYSVLNLRQYVLYTKVQRTLYKVQKIISSFSWNSLNCNHFTDMQCRVMIRKEGREACYVFSTARSI